MAGYADTGLAAQEAQNQSFFNSLNSFTIQAVRVKFTFLNLENIKTNYPKLFEKYGQYNTFGGILFDSFSNPTLPVSELYEDNLINTYNFAKPLFPNIRHVPLLNELTYVVSFPSVRTQDPRNIDLNQTDYYYFQPINLWNTLHQNAFPDPLIDWNAETESQPKKYFLSKSRSRCIYKLKFTPTRN
jgi:hypothetical protein